MGIPGKIIGTKLSKKVKRSKHYLRFIGGYAWSAERLNEAKSRGVETLELIEDTGRVLTISLQRVLSGGRRFQFGTFEPQIGISEALMTIVDPRQKELFQ